MLQAQITTEGHRSDRWVHQLFDSSIDLFDSQAPEKEFKSVSSTRVSPSKGHPVRPKKKNRPKNSPSVLPASLVILQQGESQSTQFPLPDNSASLLIGRSKQSDITLQDSMVSGRHAKIVRHQNRYLLFDLGSAMGTQLNRQQLCLGVATPLKNGDIIKIANNLLRLKINPSDADCNLPDQIAIGKGSTSVKQPVGTEPGEQRNIQNVLLSSSAALANQNDRQKRSQEIFEAEVIEVIEESPDTKTFRMIALSDSEFNYQPGQYINLIVDINGRTVKRAYSLSSSPSRPRSLDITIKRVSGGLVSNWLCDYLETGDRLKFKGPFGQFSCYQRPADKLLFIGAGSGTTPLVSMGRWLNDSCAKPDAKMLFSFRSLQDILFRNEFEFMAQSSNGLELGISLTGDEKNRRGWHGLTGRINAEMLLSFVPDLLERTVYLCGPLGFMNAVKSALNALNFPTNHLHCESFGTPTAEKSYRRSTPDSKVDTLSGPKSNKRVATS